MTWERRVDAWTDHLHMEHERREDFSGAVDAQAHELAAEIVGDANLMGEWVDRGALLPHELTFAHPDLGRSATLQDELLRLLAAHDGPVQDAIIAAVADMDEVRELARATLAAPHHDEES